MTLIVGIDSKEGVFIGSDSRGSDSMGRYFDDKHKIISIKNFKLGYSASYRTAQIIENNKQKFDNINKQVDVYKFLEKLRGLMQKHGNIEKSTDKTELQHDSIYLILATKLGVYKIYGNYQYEKSREAFCGSGEYYAQGYFDALKNIDTAKRIKTTIEATSKRINSVGGKVKVVKVI